MTDHIARIRARIARTGNWPRCHQTGKRIYQDETTARHALAWSILLNTGPRHPVRYYPCGRHWHLTSRPAWVDTPCGAQVRTLDGARVLRTCDRLAGHGGDWHSQGDTRWRT